MVKRSSLFVPETLLAAPRRSAGIPNSDGSFILYTVSSYSFSNHESTSEVRVLDTATSESTLIDGSKEASNPVWLDDETVALLRGNGDEATELVIGNPHSFKESCYVAGLIEAPADNLKVIKLNSGHYGMAFTAKANPDGTLFSPKSAKKPRSTARLYRSLFVRHWDKYIDQQRNSIWYGALTAPKISDRSKPALQMSALVNALKGSGLECPIPPFGGTDHFDIGRNGLVFTAKDPSLDPARNTKCNIYFSTLRNFCEAAPQLSTLDMGPIAGAMSSPVFSPDGGSIAFLAMKQNGYEADKNQVFFIPDISKPTKVVNLLGSTDGRGRWSQSPSSLKFSLDGHSVYLLADSVGRKRLFRLALKIRESDQVPICLTNEGSVSDFHPLDHESEQLFISSSSLVESSVYFKLTLQQSNVENAPTLCEISSMTRGGAMFGLSRAQIKEFWFSSVDTCTQEPYNVHTWMVVPATFDESQRYPLAFLVHGGPQSAWADSWSTRWNAALFAEQEYVVILPNPTGSTGYGQDFTDAIREQWGGRPYEDLVRCFETLERMPFIDTDRAVALGASYGGYMMNWIQGHPLGRRFKALVTHDGVFSMLYQLATDELYFVDHDLGRYKPDNENFRRWDPARFTDQWSTPHLIIHSDCDYRLSVADGLATFNVLQVQGIESEFLNFPNENHWVLKPENSLVWHATVFNWINRHVGLPPCTIVDGKDAVQDPSPAHLLPLKQLASISLS